MPESIPLMHRSPWWRGHAHLGPVLLGYNLRRLYVGVAVEHERRGWLKLIVYVGPLWLSLTRVSTYLRERR